MFCTKCGKQIDDGSKFCEYCGAVVEVEEIEAVNSMEVSDSEEKENKNLVKEETDKPTVNLEIKEDIDTFEPEVKEFTEEVVNENETINIPNQEEITINEDGIAEKADNPIVKFVKKLVGNIDSDGPIYKNKFVMLIVAITIIFVIVCLAIFIIHNISIQAAVRPIQ